MCGFDVILDKKLRGRDKCPKCSFPVLAECKLTPIGSKYDYSYEEWKSDHIDEHASYKKENK